MFGASYILIWRYLKFHLNLQGVNEFKEHIQHFQQQIWPETGQGDHAQEVV